MAPRILPLDHPLGATAGLENRLYIERRAAPPLLLSAAGAGRWPTAEAVLADLYDLRNPAPQGASTSRDSSSSKQFRPPDCRPLNM